MGCSSFTPPGILAQILGHLHVPLRWPGPTVWWLVHKARANTPNWDIAVGDTHEDREEEYQLVRELMAARAKAEDGVGRDRINPPLERVPP